jgi:peptide methionine sulfoxide reductase MsrA
MMEKATFGAGCFRGAKSFLREIRSVQDEVGAYPGDTAAASPACRHIVKLPG